MADEFKIVASLDIPKSASAINKDIPKLEGQAKRLKIVADLNPTLSLKNIQKTLDKLQNNANIKIGIDTSGLNSTQSATQNITNNLKNVQTQAQQTASAVKNAKSELMKLDTTAVENTSFKAIFANEADSIVDLEKTLANARQELSKFGKVDFSWLKDAGGNISEITAKITDATGVVERFRYAFNIDAGNFGWAGSVGTDSGVEKLTQSMQKAQDKVKALRTNLTAELKSIRSDWQDINGGKSVKSDENIERLKQQYIKAAQAIRELRNADDTTFTSMKANADTQIDKLNQMVTRYHNAEKVATQLRAKGFETVKIDTGNNIDKFINSINNSKVPIQAMQTEINKLTSDFAQLDTIQDQASKSASLTNILNTLDNANTKFQSLKELFKGFGNSDWLATNSEQINKISDISTKVAIYKEYLSATSTEWKSQGLYIGEIKTKLTSLARGLPNIKKPEKFNEWVQEWTAINQQATKLKTNLDSQVTSQNKIYEIQSQIAKLDPHKNATEIGYLNNQLQVEQKTLSSLQAQSNVYNKIVSQAEREQYVKEKTVEAQEKLSRTVNRATDKQNIVDEREILKADQLAQKIEVLKTKIEAYRSINTKAEKTYGSTFDGIIDQLNQSKVALSNGNIQEVDKTLQRINKEFQFLQNNIVVANKTGKTLFQSLYANTTKFSKWMLTTFTISTFAREIRNAVSELKDMDTILTEISKTSDRTATNLEQLGKKSFDVASQYGRTESDYLTGIQEMSRAGFGETESEDMAELSILAQSAGDMTAELANEYLIATNAGYKLRGSAEKLNSVLDSQNYITNHNALNMSELAEATKIVSSQAAQSGIGIDEMTAAVGTMIATTQQGGEVAARALKGKRTLCTIALYGCESIVA